jgi:hypothetical protein
MLVVLQIVTNGFYCRKSYRLLKIKASEIYTQRHPSAWRTLSVLGIALRCQNSRNGQPTICFSNSEQYTVASVHVLTSRQFFICHFSRRQNCVTKHAMGGRGIDYQSISLLSITSKDFNFHVYVDLLPLWSLFNRCLSYCAILYNKRNFTTLPTSPRKQ